jgi:hypothetical protein
MDTEPDLANQVRQSVTALLSDYFGAQASENLRVDESKSTRQDIIIHKTWALNAELSHERRRGRVRGQVYRDHATCVADANARCSSISNGQDESLLRELEAATMQSPHQCLWDSSIKFGTDDAAYCYEHACSSCDGEGWSSCASCWGRGDHLCSGCNGRRNITCHSCGGRKIHGNGHVCLSCSGRGIVACTTCSQKGRVYCMSCGGKGKCTCHSCNGAGYFTEIYRVHVAAQAQLKVLHPEGLADWHKHYFKAALEGSIPWAPLSAICEPTAETLRSEARYPVVYQMPAAIVFTQARLDLAGHVSEGFFLGPQCTHYKLQNLAAPLLRTLTKKLWEPSSADALKPVLESKAAAELLDNRSRLDDTTLVRSGLIGRNDASFFLTEYGVLLLKLKKQRSHHGLGSWILHGLMYALAILVLFGIADALSGNRILWEKTGLAHLAAEWHVLGDFYIGFIRELWWAPGSVLPTVGTTLGMLAFYLLVWWLLLSRRRMTIARFLISFTLSSAFVVFLTFLYIEVLVLAVVEIPGSIGVANMLEGLVNALISLPEAMLAGLLIAALRLRQQKDKLLKRFVTGISCPALWKDLRY